MSTPTEPPSADSDSPSAGSGSQPASRTGQNPGKRSTGEAAGRAKSTSRSESRRDRADSGSAPLLKWSIAALVAVLVAAAAVAILRGADEQANDVGGAQVSGAQVSDVTVSGIPLPGMPSQPGAPDSAVGAPAPSFRSSSFDGSEVSVDTGDGRAKVIAFFAHWCPHCQRELPRIAGWLAGNELPDGVDLIAVSTSVDPRGPNYPPSAWFDAVGWSEAVLSDSADNEIASIYGLSGFPYTVLVDGRGTVVARISGGLSDARWESLMSEAAAARLAADAG